MKTTLVVSKIATRYHFRDNSTAGIIMHVITGGVVVAPRQNATKTMRLSINNSIGVISIVTITTRITIPDGA